MIGFRKNENGNLNVSVEDLKKLNEFQAGKTETPLGNQFIEFDTKNFDTCKHRSKDKIIKLQACCGNKDQKIAGFQCYKLSLFNILPIDCSQCTFYESL